MSSIDIKYYLKRLENRCKATLSSAWAAAGPWAFKKEAPSFPRRLYFEVTNICNCRCVFCAYRKIFEKPEHKKGAMSFDVFKKAFDDYTALGGKTISLTPTIGEPLLDPGILKKIDYAVNAGIKRVYFYTNGILLNKDGFYKKIIDSGVKQIGLSSPGFDRELFGRIFGVPFYDETLAGAHSLLKYNKSLGEPVEIKINFRSSSKPSRILKTPDFLRLIKPYLSSKVVCTFLVDYDNWGGTVGQGDLEGIMKLKKPFFCQRRPCLRTFEAAVLYDGRIRLCGCRIKDTEDDELVVGDISQNSLAEIFLGEKARKAREGFILGEPPAVCRHCSLYDPGDFDYSNYIEIA